MRQSALILLAMFLLAAVQAQSSRLRTGVKASRTGDYEKAVAELSAALEDPLDLNARKRTQAYYYRGHARVMLLRQLGQVKQNGRLQEYARTHLDAFDDLREAEASDSGKYAPRIRQDRRLLFDLILDEVLGRLSYARQSNISQQRMEMAFRDARALLLAAEKMNGDHYLLHDLWGQVYLGMEEYDEALNAFRKAIRAFREQPPASPDLLFAYAFYRRALIHVHYRYQEAGGVPHKPTKYDVDQALASIDQGLKTLKEEYERLRPLLRSLPEVTQKKFSRQYQSIHLDLRNLQLDIYLNAPERYNEALQTFDEAIREDPDQYLYRIAYGQLMELSSAVKATSIYEEAIQVAPHRTEAYYNLGVVLLNRAARLVAEANEEEHMDRYRQLMDEAEGLLERARPHFEAAYRTDPQNLEVLNALIQICATLDDTRAYLKYKNAKISILSPGQ